MLYLAGSESCKEFGFERPVGEPPPLRLALFRFVRKIDEISVAACNRIIFSDRGQDRMRFFGPASRGSFVDDGVVAPALIVIMVENNASEGSSVVNICSVHYLAGTNDDLDVSVWVILTGLRRRTWHDRGRFGAKSVILSCGF